MATTEKVQTETEKKCLQLAANARVRPQTEKKWFQQFDNLKKFLNSQGHCNVPQSQGSLGFWVTTQRKKFRQGDIRADRKILLDEIGFAWNSAGLGPYRLPASVTKVRKISNTEERNKRRKNISKEENPPTKLSRWDKHWRVELERLKAFQAEHGHCNVVQSQGSLGQWVHNQRRFYREGRMPADRIALLNEIDFVWQHVGARKRGASNKEQKLDSVEMIAEGAPMDQEKIWIEQFNKLKAFRDAHGHCNVPNNGGSLGQWVALQRAFFRAGRMREDRKKLLGKIGFLWTVLKNKSWEDYYDDLLAYKRENGHCHVRSNERGYLSCWVRKQRGAYRAGQMENDRKKLLEDIGFAWNTYYEDQWQSNYSKLIAYEKENGHFNVPNSGKQRFLATWVQKQRSAWEHDVMRGDRKKLLYDIGFFGGNCDYEGWMEEYKLLERFWLLHGHVNVPAEDPLSTWMEKQRLDHETGLMDTKKKSMLDLLGFFCHGEIRMKKYNEHELSSCDHGHVNVPPSGLLSSSTKKQRFEHVNVPTDGPLSSSTKKQQLDQAEGQMDTNAKEMLECLGFFCEDKMWQDKYNELEEFWLDHGHVNVPAENPLSAWLEKQRLDHATGHLDSKKKALLDLLEFVWEDPDFQGYAATLVVST